MKMNTNKIFPLAGVFVSVLILVSCKKTETVTEFVTVPPQYVQVDRMAIPAINTALMPSNMKDAFNQGQPSTDAANFRTTAQNTITGLRTAVDAVLGAENGGPLGNLTPALVAVAFIPDIVTIDFSMPVAFPNGRRLQDDVIDAALGIVLNRGGAAGVSDGINANDKPFLTSFPYLASDNVSPLSKPAGNPYLG